MSVPSDLQYTTAHEWLRIEGNTATLGITAHAQEQLGDVVFVELPPIGEHIVQGDAFGTVESVKAVSDLYAPVTGEVVEVNEMLATQPEQVNLAPYESGWMLKVQLAPGAVPEGLLDATAYLAHIAQ